MKYIRLIKSNRFDFGFVTPIQKKPKYKVGDVVEVSGKSGKITRIIPVKLSDTAAYEIEIDGKKIQRYEEEIDSL